MQRWTYSQYRAAVRGDVDYAISKHGYLPIQAIGFAHNELALRLEEYPEEAVLALVALGFEARNRQLLDAYPEGDAFIEEVMTYLELSRVEAVRRGLPDSEQAAFKEDALALAHSLNARK